MRRRHVIVRQNHTFQRHHIPHAVRPVPCVCSIRCYSQNRICFPPTYAVSMLRNFSYQSAIHMPLYIYQLSFRLLHPEADNHCPGLLLTSLLQTVCQRMAVPFPASYPSNGQKRELSGVSISSPRTTFPFSSRPNSNFVSAMMIPLLNAYSAHFL